MKPEIVNITRTTFPGWEAYPAYHVPLYEDFFNLNIWMNKNDMKPFLLSSGSNGYTFQVRNNTEFFELTWL